MKATAVLTVLRDAGCILVGLGGIIWQQVTGQVNVELLLVYTTLLGVPGTLALLQLSRGRQETPPTAMESSSSPSSRS